MLRGPFPLGRLRHRIGWPDVDSHHISAHVTRHRPQFIVYSAGLAHLSCGGPSQITELKGGRYPRQVTNAGELMAEVIGFVGKPGRLADNDVLFFAAFHGCQLRGHIRHQSCVHPLPRLVLGQNKPAAVKVPPGQLENVGLSLTDVVGKTNRQRHTGPLLFESFRTEPVEVCLCP